MDKYFTRAKAWLESADDHDSGVTPESVEVQRSRFQYRIKHDTSLTQSEKIDMQRTALLLKNYIDTAGEILEPLPTDDLEGAPPPAFPKDDGTFYADVQFDASSLADTASKGESTNLQDLISSGLVSKGSLAQRA